ncbi:MAG TPA: hypothetical protein DCM62_05270, partial [Bacteroidales bacterium]|nr:hypothetical protein [Bacteroidales bacterium]
ARFIPEEKRIEAPSKIISFNPDSISEASLLIEYISGKEQKPFAVVKKQVEEYVSFILDALAAGRMVKMDRVGVLRSGSLGRWIFEPDLSVNYLADTSGMPSILEPEKKQEKLYAPIPEREVSVPDRMPEPVQTPFNKSEPPILVFHNRDDEEKPSQIFHSEEKPKFEKVQRQKSHVSREPVKWASTIKWTAFFIVPVLVILVFLFFNWEYIVGDRRITTSPETPTGTEATVPGNGQQQGEAAEPVAAEAVVETQQVVAGEGRFHIIVGAFRSMRDATELVERLNQHQSDRAKVLARSAEGFYRVSFGSYATQNEANANLQNAKQTVTSDAWVLFY